MWRSLPYSEGGDRLYQVTAADLHRPDIISWRMYGRADLWWAILDYNAIPDPFTIEAGDSLRVPDPDVILTLLRDRERLTASLEANTVVEAALVPPPPYVARRVPPYATPYADETTVSTEEDEAFTYLHTFTLFGPDEEPETAIHFQIQLAAESGFATVLLSRMSAVDQLHWQYFNPEGGGAFESFPATGLPSPLFNQRVLWSLPDDTENITTGVQYYMRYRFIINQVEQAWTAPEAITFAA